MLEITEAAGAVLERAYEATSRFDPDARVRVFRRGDAIETGFAHDPEPGDAVIEHEGMTVFVAAGLEGTLDVSEEHDHLLLRQ